MYSLFGHRKVSYIGHKWIKKSDYIKIRNSCSSEKHCDKGIEWEKRYFSALKQQRTST